MRNIAEFDERFALKLHSGEYIILYVIISSCVRIAGKFGHTYAPVVSRGGIIFGDCTYLNIVSKLYYPL